jgi:CRISPR-associated protein Cas6
VDRSERDTGGPADSVKSLMVSNYWSEAAAEKARRVEPDVIDLVFRIKARQLPSDHAFALSTALQTALPWLVTEKKAAIHLIHGAQSSNGWQRPDDDGVIELSGRTRLTLRLPHSRLDDAHALIGQTLSLCGHALSIGDARTRPISPLSTLFAHYIHVPASAEAEPQFLEAAATWLEALSIIPRKMLCGRTRYLSTPQGPLVTRSLLVADLSPEEALRLQTEGLGDHRLLGCGVFVPSKSIAAVYDPEEEH